MRLLRVLLDLALRLWDRFASPAARRARAAREADRAVREHDEARVNEIFNRGKR